MKRLTSLAVLQLEQYDTTRFLAKKNINPEVIKRIKWTARLKLTKILSYPLGIVGANMVIGSAVKIYENWVWYRVRTRIQDLKKSGMKVVAIAGSYGKTTVKHYAHELLRHKFRVVSTPESFNTILGIAKCLEYEVDDRTEVFIVEVGAYHVGDITHLLKMVSPDIGVLTGIARQHLERFGSFAKIIQAKSEIAEYMKKVNGVLIVNGSDHNVVEAVQKIGIHAKLYDGINREAINIAGAKLIARSLKIEERELENNKIRPVKNRFEMTMDRYGMRVIDDSFSSNDKGFADAVEHLGKQTKYTRILVTPGLVELGDQTKQIHEELGGKLVGNADLVILVGHNERTKSLEQGTKGKVKIMYIEKTLEFMRLVKSLKLKKEPLVLLENDVTENY